MQSVDEVSIAQLIERVNVFWRSRAENGNQYQLFLGMPMDVFAKQDRSKSSQYHSTNFLPRLMIYTPV